MLPRLGTSKVVSAWLSLTLVASAANALDGGWLASWLALEPHRIFRGEVWRLVTWALIQDRLVVCGMTCLAIFKIGSDLSASWGEARLRRYALATIALGGIAVALVALVTGDGTVRVLGGLGVLDALGIAWLRQFPQGTLTWFGIEFRGPARLTLVVGFNVLLALVFGFRDHAAELAICAAALAYPRSTTPSRA